MLKLVQVVASLAIAAWGLLMVLLGIVGLGIPLAVAVLVAGLPLLASHPWAQARSYPSVAGPARR